MIIFEDVVAAYFDCRRGKGHSPAVAHFDMYRESRLYHIFSRLSDGTWRPSPSRVFVISDPKPREVWAAPFEDRIVHQWVYNQMAHTYFRSFIFDSYACIPGKGIHHAARRVQSMSASITDSYKKRAFYIKMDIANFFQSMDMNCLWDILVEDRIMGSNEVLQRVVNLIIYDQRRNESVFLHGNDFNSVPLHKRLSKAPSSKGIPIGNLTSQLFANIYMNRIDQYIKRVLRVKKYLRYVDDMLALFGGISEVRDYESSVNAFLGDYLYLQANPSKTRINEISKGVDFLGYYVLPGRIYVRHSTYSRVSGRISGANEASYRGLFGLTKTPLPSPRDCSSKTHPDKTTSPLQMEGAERYSMAVLA